MHLKISLVLSAYRVSDRIKRRPLNTEIVFINGEAILSSLSWLVVGLFFPVSAAALSFNI